MQQLLSLYEGAHERVGFILTDGSIVEVENICSDPENGFEISGDDLLRYHDQVSATWHTHPNESSALSSGDKLAFLNYSGWTHHIIGTDGISTYVVRNEKVMLEAEGLSARLPEEDP